MSKFEIVYIFLHWLFFFDGNILKKKLYPYAVE